MRPGMGEALAYLAIKKVKGRFYLYRQESYREGGKVRTRTVEYLGAVDPATAAKVKDTRRKLGKMDMDALAASVKGAVAAEIVPEPPRTPEKASGSNHIPQTAQRAQKPPQKAMIEASDDAPGPSERERQTRSMIAGGEHVTVDTRTGEILTSHGPAPGQVITTETPVRPYRESLELPGDLDQHGLSNTALQRTHRRYGQRLQTLGINPGNMATVSIAYGHPDKFTRKRDGSHIVQVSRRTGNKRHTINKTALWKHYRQAMSMAYLDTIERTRPDLFQSLANALDHSHRETQRLVFQCLPLASSPGQRLGLSLQLYFWDRIPASVRGKANPAEFGQASFDTVNDWKAETATILAEVQKSGWDGFTDCNTKARKKLKARVSTLSNHLRNGGLWQKMRRKLSGQQRRIIREIMATEKKLQAVDRLQNRIDVIKMALDF